jgi:uncharacterized protein
MTPHEHPDGRHYPMRRPETAMNGEEQAEVLRAGTVMTLALCRENEPYAVPLYYCYHEEANCFYVHGGRTGKRLDYLRSNQHVWGVVVEDGPGPPEAGGVSRRSVMFEGLAEFVEEPAEKARAMAMMIGRYEGEKADAVKARMLVSSVLDRIMVIRLRVVNMSGRRNFRPEA